MKRIIFIISILSAVVFSGCEDILETPAKSTLDESIIFSTYDLALGAVDGIKVPLAETNSYRGRFIPFYGMNTDIEWFNLSERYPNSQADLHVYGALPNNSQMNTANNAWAQMYSSIERANICIRGLREYGDVENNPELAQLLGEAITLRAVVYSDLLKAWGDVPARFEPISSETLYLPKSSRDVIYKQLIADLEEAATLVPWPNQSDVTSTVERVSKAFVLALRARLILKATGFSQYPDGIRRSNDPDLTVDRLYPEAWDDIQEIINSGTVRLDPSFENVFRMMCQDNVSAGNESLWEIPFSDGRGRVLFTFAVRHNSVNQHTGQPRGGQSGPTPIVFYDYDVKDKRRDVSVVPYDWAPAIDGVSQQQLLTLKKWSFGKYRYEWMNRYVTSSNDDGVNKLYMRYAEVILMAAEIANELEGPAAAAPYLKQIRQRAFDQADWAEKVDAYVDALTTKEAMFDAIVEEHKLEFVGEMIRKESLIRWNLLKEKLDEAKTKMYALRERTGEYADVPQMVYYRYADDGETLETYGFNRGEFDDVSAEYDFVEDFVNAEDLPDEKIESIYARNPDQYQFWPIWQVFLDASNGQLKNDYGY